MGFYDAIRVGASGAAEDFTVDRSLRFNDDDSPYLQRQPSSNTSGSSQKITISFWIKIGNIPSGTNGGTFFGSSGNTHMGQFFNQTLYFDNNSSYWINTTGVFRDPSAWYHVVYVIDTTQGTSTDRQKIYVNGVLQDRGNTVSDPSQNAYVDFFNNSSKTYYIGRRQAGNYFDGYLAEINFVDGLAYDPSYFGETDATTGQWNPIDTSGLTFGTNGFRLKFADNSGTTATTLGKDSSGNSNNFTPNNFSVSAGIGYDSMADTPTNNFPTLSPFDKSSDIVLYNGNLRYSFASRPNVRTVRATFTLPSSGKYYWEFCNEQASSNAGRISMGVVDITVAGQAYNTNPNSNGYIQYSYGGGININGSSIGVGASWYNTERAAIAVDCDTGKFWFGKVASGGTTTWYNSTAGTDGNPATGSNQTTTLTTPSNFMPFGGWNEGGNGSEFFSASINFGQQPFLGTEPTGYVKLSSANLPDPTILLPNKHFAAFTYTGSGSSGDVVNITNSDVDFTPDWVWVKSRATTNNHILTDAVRGGTKYLNSASTGAEVTDTDTVRDFLQGGFESGTDGDTNWPSRTFVAWNWNGGGSTASNSDGSITSSVRANTTAGFSIIGYTGTGGAGTIGHGLGVAPKVAIVRRRDSASDWAVFHAEVGNTKRLVLNSTAAESSANSSFFNNTSPTSTTISLGSDAGTGGSTDNYIVYAFSEVAGYSKFGSYTGNGNDNGTFVFTGFRPAWVLIKNSSSGSTDWILKNATIDTFNVMNKAFKANTSDTEFASLSGVDFLSNGFKIRNNGSFTNTNGNTYVYLAFAESPFKNARAR